MGGGGSKTAIRNQHEKDVEDDRRRRIAEGEQRKREQDAELQRQRDALLEQKQRDIDEAARKNLEKVNAEIAEMEKYKEKQQEEMAAWRARAREQAKKENEEMEAQAKIEMEKKLKEHAEEEAKLAKKLEALNEARAQLLKTADDGLKQRTEMQSKHKELTDKQTKEHNDYIMNKREEVYQHTLAKQDELKALKETGRANRLALQSESLGMISNSIRGGNAVIDALDFVGAHDNFRLDCDALRMYFKGFTDAYDIQAATVTRVASAMRWRKPLVKDLPQRDVINAAFNAFNRSASTLKIPDNFEELQAPLDEVMKSAKSIDNSIAEIETLIEGYMGLVELTPQDKEQMKECHDGVKEQIALIETTVASLVKLMRKFVIPASTAVADEINRQGIQLGVETQKKITNGSASQKALED
ncbi:hypothetical protein CAEBREN_14000 [Caenorhabditis brenneri]|uniref:Uncharacterized protein n=1 Tax=Caenorhabditis brenneri TaxID=135651 RepID=G0NWD7_CAEBE|nr:hypothetical protein CAEBREN_14000 [Caenorhabditis brenneri]